MWVLRLLRCTKLADYSNSEEDPVPQLQKDIENLDIDVNNDRDTGSALLEVLILLVEAIIETIDNYLSNLAEIEQ